MGSFTTFKTLMPALRGGFPYDRLHADLDVLLHGGIDPGPVLMALFSNPHLQSALQWNYAAVWMAMTFVPIFFVVLQARGLRLRYCLSFVLVWALLGNLIACGFLSAGPAFYAQVTGDVARFGSQMQALDGSMSALFQAYLWDNYARDSLELGSGISAFPSIHVGMAMMNALFLRDVNRIAGMFGMAYVAVVAVSSVLFGWHYAIDGYVSIVVVLLLHVAFKRMLIAKPAISVEQPLTRHPTPATP